MFIRTKSVKKVRLAGLHIEGLEQRFSTLSAYQDRSCDSILLSVCLSLFFWPRVHSFGRAWWLKAQTDLGSSGLEQGALSDSQIPHL